MLPSLDRTNPFCALRACPPGTIEFVFEPGKSLQQLVDALEANAWQGQIIGVHGTGKSTLLASLTVAIEDRGRSVSSATLCDRTTTSAAEFFRSLRASAGQGVAAVDGVEQLHTWNRLLLKRFCRDMAWGSSWRRIAVPVCPISMRRPSTRRGPGVSSSGFKTAFRHGSKSTISCGKWQDIRANARRYSGFTTCMKRACDFFAASRIVVYICCRRCRRDAKRRPLQRMTE